MQVVQKDSQQESQEHAEEKKKKRKSLARIRFFFFCFAENAYGVFGWVQHPSAIHSVMTEMPSCDGASDVTVHYMHGLESGPRGRKANFLRQWFRVVSPDQHMSAFNPRKRNSPMRWILAFVAVALTIFFAARSSKSRAAIGTAALLAFPVFVRYVVELRQEYFR